LHGLFCESKHRWNGRDDPEFVQIVVSVLV
jgi:hypothetical protein